MVTITEPATGIYPGIRASLADLMESSRKWNGRFRLSNFPALEAISFCGVGFAVTRGDFIHSPVVSENPYVDEALGRKFEFASEHVRGWSRNFYVAYSGPKVDIALDVLARTVDCAPKRIRWT